MIETYAKRLEHRQSCLNCVDLLKTEFKSSDEFWSFYLRSRNLLVSTKGRVKSFTTGKIKKPTITTQGYHTIKFTHLDGRQLNKGIHRMVAETFFPIKNQKFLEVNHINGDKSNNSVENLEWMTREENLQHARDNKLFKQQFGETNGRYKYTPEFIAQVKDLLEAGFSYNEIAIQLGLTYSQVTHLVYRRIRK